MMRVYEMMTAYKMTRAQVLEVTRAYKMTRAQVLEMTRAYEMTKAQVHETADLLEHEMTRAYEMARMYEMVRAYKTTGLNERMRPLEKMCLLGSSALRSGLKTGKKPDQDRSFKRLQVWSFQNLI